MKKSVLLAVFCFYSVSAWADRCVWNAQNITQSAFQQLKNMETIVHYCPTCRGDNHVRYINISNLKILQKDSEQMILSGQEHLDFAYIYLPTNKINIYQNLGYITHCTDLINSPVSEYLDITHPYGIEKIEKFIEQTKQCPSPNCLETIYQNILQNYFETKSNTLKGFSSEQIKLPEKISKTEIQKLLVEISHYYGVE